MPIFQSLKFLSLIMDRNSEGRRNAFKSKGVFKPEEIRRRREAQQVEIRKQKREENLTKRRNFNANEFSEDSDDDIDISNTENQVSSWPKWRTL